MASAGRCSWPSVGLALRVGYVFAYRRHITPTGDAFYFHYQADLLASGKGFIDPYSLFWAADGRARRHPPAVVDAGRRPGGRARLDHVLRPAALELCHRRRRLWSVVADGGRARWPDRAPGSSPRCIAALYPVFLVDDGSLLAETLVVPLVALVVWAFYRLWRRPSLPRAALLGALCALCALTRSELVLLVVFLAASRRARCAGRARGVGRLGLCAVALLGGRLRVRAVVGLHRAALLTPGTAVGPVRA